MLKVVVTNQQQHQELGPGGTLRTFVRVEFTVGGIDRYNIEFPLEEYNAETVRSRITALAEHASNVRDLFPPGPVK